MPTLSLQDLGINMNLPKVSTISNIVLISVGIILGLIILGVITWLYIRYKRYNKKIVVFSKINNSIVPTQYDRGMFQRVGIAGDVWCKTMKTKKILPRPNITMGKDIYWFFIREDGEWINFSLQDIDKVMKEAKCYFVDEDMRLQRLGIERIIRQRFETKPSFFAKYGVIIMNILFIILIMVALILLFREIGKLADKLGNVASSIGQLADATNNMLRQTGSGVRIA